MRAKVVETEKVLNGWFVPCEIIFSLQPSDPLTRLAFPASLARLACVSTASPRHPTPHGVRVHGPPCRGPRE